MQSFKRHPKRPFRSRPLRAERLESRRMLAVEIEPNDDIASATPSIGGERMEGEISSAGDVDFFRLDLRINDWFFINPKGVTGQRFSPPFAPGVTILDSAGNPLATSDDGSFLRFYAPSAGVYYVRVDATNAFGTTIGDYSISTTRCCGGERVNNEVEPNNSIETAQAVTGVYGSFSSPTDEDHYSIQVLPGDALAVHFYGLAESNPSVEVLDEQGVVVASSADGTGVTYQVQGDGQNPKSLFVRLLPQNQFGLAAEEYTASFVRHRQVLTAPELGDSFDEAVPMTGDGQMEARLGRLSRQDDVDVYQFEVDAIDSSLFNFADSPNAGNPHVENGKELRLYNRFGQLLGHTTRGRLDTSTVDALTPGTYFIEVRAVGPLGVGPYKLSRHRSTEFALQRDNTLHYMDFDGDDSYFGFPRRAPYAVPDAIPFYVGSFESRYSPFEVDVTLQKPNDRAEVVSSGIGDFGNAGGIGNGDHGRRSANGESVVSTRESIVGPFGNRTSTVNHEFGHAVGLPHSRNSQSLMSYSFGEVLPPGTAFGFIDAAPREPTSGPHNERNYLDWILQPGAQVIIPESTSDDGDAQATDLQSFFDEMTVDARAVSSIDVTGQAVAGDFDGDDKLDFAVGSTHYRVEQDGTIAIIATDQPAVSVPLVTTVNADFNGDGIEDVATAPFHKQEIRLTLGSVGGNVSETTQTVNLSFFPGLLQSADINSDGISDLIFSGRSSVQLLFGGQSGFSRPIAIETGKGESPPAVGDFDGDGKIELVVPNSADDNAVLVEFADNDPRNDRVVVYGAIDQVTDVDRYTFDVTAGERFTLDIDAAEFQYPLDATIAVFGASGQLLVSSDDALDRNSGFHSVDPFIDHRFESAGEVTIEVAGKSGSAGNYRLKVTPERALSSTGPRVHTILPVYEPVGSGLTLDGMSELVFRFNAQLDPATLTDENITVVGENTGVQIGSAIFNPLDASLIWLADQQLPIDTYTITLRGESGGITDLNGNLLDGEVDADFAFPEQSGDGNPGGSFVVSMTIGEVDDDPGRLRVGSTRYTRTSYQRGSFSMQFDEGLSNFDALSSEFVLRGAGLDGQLDSADDTLQPLDVHHDAAFASVLRLDSRGIPDAGDYRIEGSVLDEAGYRIEVSTSVTVTPSRDEYLHGPSITDSSIPWATHLTSNADVPNQVSVTFSGQIDPSTLTTDSLKLRHSVDPTFFDGNDTYLVDADGAIEFDPARLTATLQFDDILPNGFFLIEAEGDPGGITDLEGNLLDGEFVNSNIVGNESPFLWTHTPSGDGIRGGDYRSMFTVARRTLGLELADIIISEKDGATQLKLTRADAAQPLSVQLTQDRDDKTTITELIEFAAGQVETETTITAIDNTMVDGTQTVVFTASADTYADASISIDVSDFEELTLNLAEDSISERDGVTTATITRTDATGAATVDLHFDGGGRFSAPNTVTIEAGKLTSPPFELSAIDNDLVDGNTSIDLTATLAGYESGSATITVTDFEPLTIVALDTAVLEKGRDANFLISRIDTGPAATILFTTRSDDLIIPPAEVTIPGGEQFVLFTVMIQNDDLVNGDREATFEAISNDYVNESITFTVQDDDVPELELDLLAGKLVESGDPITAVLRRNTTTPLVVQLNSDPPDSLHVPETIEFEENVREIEFQISAIDNQRVDGSQVATIRAETADHPNADVLITIFDDEVAGFRFIDGEVSVTESGATQQTSVVLDAQPASDVTVEFAASEDLQIAIEPARVTFTPETWNTPKSVSIQAIDDSTVETTTGLTLIASIVDEESARLFHDLESIAQSVSVLDNDQPGFQIQADAETLIVDFGDNGEFSLRLAAQPLTPVTVVVASNLPDVTLTPSLLDFSPQNWDQLTNVGVFASADLSASAPRLGEIRVEVDSARSDTHFASLEEQQLSLLLIDPATSDLRITEEADSIVLADQATQFIFQSSSDSPVFRLDDRDDNVSIEAIGQGIVVNTFGGNDLIESSSDAPIQLDAGAGDDTFRSRMTVSELFLADEELLRLRNIETLDLFDSELQSLRFSSTDVVRVTDDRNTLEIRLSKDAAVRVDGSWQVESPIIVAGVTLHQLVGDATVQIDNQRLWQNPLQRFDVDRSGLTTAGDALLIINRLAQGNTSRLPDQLIPDVEHRYYDVNGDDNATALDALQVINRIKAESNAEAEVVLIPGLVDRLNVDSRIHFDGGRDVLVTRKMVSDFGGPSRNWLPSSIDAAIDQWMEESSDAGDRIEHRLCRPLGELAWLLSDRESFSWED